MSFLKKKNFGFTSYHVYSSYNRGKGFTLMEMLVVIAILAIFVTIGTVVAREGRMRARDNERKVTLENLRVALELYRDQHGGKYPCSGPSAQQCQCSGRNDTICSGPANAFYSSEPGNTNGYSNNSGQWIPDLVPTYIAALPRDPLGGISSSVNCSGKTRQYVYFSNNGDDYALYSFCATERTVLTTDPYYSTSLQNVNYRSQSLEVCTPFACIWWAPN